jgi:hypothetical protein
MRDCGVCNLCCKLLAVEGLDKAPGQWCAHVVKGVGCGVYETRPSGCRVFNCHFLSDETLGEAWRPSRARFFVHADGDARTYNIEVDPGSPLAWKAEPFHDQLKRWAELARTGEGRVLVHVGARTLAVFPERDIDLGETRPGDVISTGYRKGPAGMAPFARVERDGAVTEYD